MNKSLDDLEPMELIQLAMMAFIYMHDNNTIGREELLDDIITWFRVFIDENDLQVIEITPNEMH